MERATGQRDSEAQERIRDMTPTSGFTEALRSTNIPMIGEIKARSATGQDLDRGRSVAELVERYATLNLPCLSVVTGRWFGGTDALLEEARRISSLPILRKDFITRRAQVDHSIDLGADAVLLTAGLLPPEGLNDLITHCGTRGVTPFVEVVDRQELSSIHAPETGIIAVNNRDIKNQERTGTGIGRSMDLAADVIRSGTPCPVSASGIEDPETANALLSIGYRGLLVGTALMADPVPERWKAVRRPTGGDTP